jgi:hypothetical protein
MPEQTPLEFEREKWLSEHELRKRELEIKEREQSRSRWSSPLVLAVLAAAIAALGNAVTMWMNGREQRALEATRAEQARVLEETKAEAARILEIIKTGNDADKAAVNLRFLVEVGLISDPDRRRDIQSYLARQPPGKGPALPAERSGTVSFDGLPPQLQEILRGERAPINLEELVRGQFEELVRGQGAPIPPSGNSDRDIR